MLTLRQLDEAQLCEVYRERMRRDFPDSELKPLEMMLRMLRAGVYDALGVFDGDELVAYALVYRRAGGRVPLLDYLAVEPSRRGQGAGSATIELLKAHYRASADALFIECEQPDVAPDTAGAQARIRFYRHSGAKLTDLNVTLFGVDFRILCLPLHEEMGAFDCEGELIALYKDMLAPSVFEQNVQLRRAQ